MEVENLRAEAEQKGFLLKEGTLLFVALRKLAIHIFNQVNTMYWPNSFTFRTTAVYLATHNA